MAPTFCTPDEAAALVRTRDTIGFGLGPANPDAFLTALGRARRLGGPDLRRCAAPRLLHGPHPPEGVLPLRLLRSGRADPAGPGGPHRAGAGRLPAVRPHPPALRPEGDDRPGRAARRRRDGQPLPAPRRHPGRAACWPAGPRPAPGRRGQPQPAPDLVAPPDFTNTLAARPGRRGGGGGRGALRPGRPAARRDRRAIAERARRFVGDGATLQIGIGAVPNMVASRLAAGPRWLRRSTARCSPTGSCGSTRRAR